jgi:hypothetical protein
MAESNGSNRKDWRELCVVASEKPDSEKLVSVVYQILQASDELDLGPGRSPLRLACAPDTAMVHPQESQSALRYNIPTCASNWRVSQVNN